MWPFSRKSKPKQIRTQRVPLRAKYDAATTSTENKYHWANADALSARAGASAGVRQRLRNRARYEVANNSYAKGIVLTLANDSVGTGPRLQLLLNDDDDQVSQPIEQAFMAWATEIKLAEKLRLMRMSKATDGEAFALMTTNDELRSPTKLDLQLVEADRINNPMSMLLSDEVQDGIRFDDFGNPQFYYMQKTHPGDTQSYHLIDDYERVPAADMIHWYRMDRPGLHRGVPEITSALPLFAQLRRYTLAVIGAAETAADFAAVLFTDAPAAGEAADVDPMDIIELEKRMATVLPDGWKLGQIKAEQPGTTYAEFKSEILNEIARCMNMPFNIAAGNSSGYNYASGRLDHQTYYKSIRVEQANCGSIVLDRIFGAWITETRLSDALQVPVDRGVPHQWFWDGTEHVDPSKEARAQEKRLANNTTTLATEYALQGRDWETELEQRAREKKKMQELGLNEAEATPSRR